MTIEKITVLKGFGKNNAEDQIDSFSIKMGEIVSIVGPTGSGKTTLINDIALFANNNTPSKRKVLINDAEPSEDFIYDPSKNPIAFITQHTNFLSDLPVKTFLKTHISIRKTGSEENLIKETIEFANQLTGEPINYDSHMTELSGGQTRSLLIADAVIIGNSPIILLDEIENAGIDRTRALELLRNYKKIFIFVTHDPRITLLSDYRLVMKNGAINKMLTTHQEEKESVVHIKEIDDLLLNIRHRIRNGERIEIDHITSKVKILNIGA